MDCQILSGGDLNLSRGAAAVVLVFFLLVAARSGVMPQRDSRTEAERPLGVMIPVWARSSKP